MPMDDTVAATVIAQTVSSVLNREDVPITVKAVPAATAKVVAAIKEDLAVKNMALVDVKSDWQSKIQWTQIVAAIATVSTLFGFNIDAATQVKILAVIGLLAPIVTFVLKKFYTKTVNASSVGT